jgi:hypothetical protein
LQKYYPTGTVLEMLTGEEESEAQRPRPYNAHADPVVWSNAAHEMRGMETEITNLREALGEAMVWILQHPPQDTGAHVTILRRIEKLISPK